MLSTAPPQPENLLLDEHNMLKITDFGLAALFAEEGKKVMLRTAVGTAQVRYSTRPRICQSVSVSVSVSVCPSQHAQYAAPEVSGDIPYDGEKADIWSCGIILYAFLTGSALPLPCISYTPTPHRQHTLRICATSVFGRVRY